MKFITFLHNGSHRVGIIDPEQVTVWPIADLVPDFTEDLLDLVRGFDDIKKFLTPTDDGIPLNDVSICAPIPRPEHNILCVGKNYLEHSKDFQAIGFDQSSGPTSGDAPEAPIIFTKAPSSVIATGEPVYWSPGVTQQVDYEAELGVIIGTAGRGIRRADAYSHVWGYMIINDVTARDLQKNHKQWFLGKSQDSFCPMGPWVATADEVDPENLELRCWINDELRQSANTRDLIFDIPTLIETISADITLQPGDIISTGTPSGVGIGFDPPKFLKPGDEMRITIDGLGELCNQIGPNLDIGAAC
jgi:2-keto-4-pentenoate hydratase/2-oxohepta-3-ene-1,7-dioic acid hydratase in catechol pathway